MSSADLDGRLVVGGRGGVVTELGLREWAVQEARLPGWHELTTQDTH